MATEADRRSAMPTGSDGSDVAASGRGGSIAAVIGNAMVGTGIAFRTRIKVKPASSSVGPSSAEGAVLALSEQFDPVAGPVATGAASPEPVLFDPGIRSPVDRAARPGPTSLKLVLGLDLIRGIDHGSDAMLRAGGVTRAADIATWTAADVRLWRNRLGAGRRLSSGNWIEQAALLAAGCVTTYARSQLDMAEIAFIPSPPVQVAEVASPVLLARLRASAVESACVSPTPSTIEDAPLVPLPYPTAGLCLLPLPPSPLTSTPLTSTPLTSTPLTSPPCADALPNAPRMPHPRTVPPAASLLIAATDFETDDVVIIPRHKPERPRPSSLVPKRPRQDTTADGRRAVTITERIESLGPLRQPPPATVATIPAADASRRSAALPLDLSALDAMDVEFPQMNVDEADVVIVRSTNAAAAVGALAARTAARARADTRTTAAVARPDRIAIDPTSYAAYRSEVVEASVAIVPVDRSANGAPTGSSVSSNDRDGEGGRRGGSMARFFNALVGNNPGRRSE